MQSLASSCLLVCLLINSRTDAFASNKAAKGQLRAAVFVYCLVLVFSNLFCRCLLVLASLVWVKRKEKKRKVYAFQRS